MLSEKSLSEKDKYHMLFMWELKLERKKKRGKKCPCMAIFLQIWQIVFYIFVKPMVSKEISL